MTRASIPWNVNQVTKAVMNGSLTFDNAIQRGFVWDVKRSSLLVDSILRGYTIPPFYTIRTDRKVQTPKGMVSVYDGIDGKQRCTALVKFLNDEFALDGLDVFVENGKEVDINGKKFSELSEDMQDTIKSYGLSVSYFSDITEDEIAEMMSRMNNGKPLTNVENARIKAKDLAGLREIASHQLFEDYLTEAAIKGYHNEDIVIKTYIMLTTPDDPCFDAKRTREVYKDVEFTDDIKARLNGIFDKTLEVVSLIENNANKKVFRKIIRKTNLLAVISTMEKDISADETAEKITEFFTTEDGSLSVSQEYNEASTNGTNHAPQVKKRIEAIGDALLPI